MTKQECLELFRDRAKGAMYGVAVGDALGAPLEFMSALEIKDVHGPEPVKDMLGGGWLNLRPGETTDDTDMTLAVAEGWMAMQEPWSLPDLVEAVGSNFIEWHHTRPKDIGNTCRAVIEKAEQLIKSRPDKSAYENWMTASILYDEMSGGRSGGNGALMRTVPAGIAFLHCRVPARALARMTHWDEKAAKLVQDYTEAISLLVRGGSCRDLHGFLLCARTQGHLRPTGYSFDSANCAAYAIQEADDDFEDILVKAVNMGGDADTIGAITGGLAGAWYGFRDIPDRWVEALPERITARLDAFVEWAVEREARTYDRE